jgi:hypothetical protein
MRWPWGEPLLWVVKKRPDEIEALEVTSLELKIGKDCRVESLVSLIKATYLTLFKLLGYSYALSADGRKIGYATLGKFFREHRDKQSEARKEARHFFRPYVNMMRTIDRFEGPRPLGTIEDGRARVCVMPDGKIFGIEVWIRANQQYYAVLMPYFDEPDGEAAYDEFMRNDDQTVRMHACQFDAEKMSLIVSEQSRVVFWPKNGVEFNFD